MSDTCNFNPNQISWIPQILGAILAIIGGFFAVIFRLRIETKQEINHIKIILCDDLSELSKIIDRMHETFTQTQIISPVYFSDLQKTTESFNNSKQRLFLFRKSDLRKEISSFYKKLDKNIKENAGRVGRIPVAGQPPQVGHNQIVTDFVNIKVEATALEKKINKYKYSVLWIF
jgi:hypothetical protein